MEEALKLFQHNVHMPSGSRNITKGSVSIHFIKICWAYMLRHTSFKF